MSKAAELTKPDNFVPQALPPEPKKFDTKTPATNESTISRVTMKDMDNWGEWLLYRLQEAWPDFDTMNFKGRLSPFMDNNGFLFIKTGADAITLATTVSSPFSPRPVLMSIFGYMTTENALDRLVALYKETISWGRSRGAVEFRPGRISDITPGRLQNRLNASKREEIYLDLTK